MKLFSPFILTCLTVLQCRAAVSAENISPPPDPLTPMTGLAETGSLLILTLKVVGGLALVVGLMLLFFVWLKKMGFSPKTQHQGSLIQVLDTRLIGPKKYVSVVRIADECLAVGVTEQQITLLGKLANEQIPVVDQQDTDSDQSAPGFAATLAKAAGWKK
jgi:flagellar biosynthetic protein FliO